MRDSTPNHLKPLKLRQTYTACFSADDSVLATLSKDVVVWDVARRAKHYRIHPVSHPSHCDFNADASRLAVKSTSGKIVTLAANDGSDVHVVDGGSDGEGSNLLYSPCSKYLVDGSWNGSLTVRDASTGTVEFRRRCEGEMVIAVSRDDAGQTWAVHHRHKHPDGSSQPDYVSLWEWPFRQPKIFEHTSRFIRAFGLSLDGRGIATCAQVHKKGYHLTVHSASDFKCAASLWLDEASSVKKIRWSPGGKELAVVRRDGFSFYRLPDLALAATLELKYAADVAYAHDGQSVALSGWECGLLLRRGSIQSVAAGDASPPAAIDRGSGDTL